MRTTLSTTILGLLLCGLAYTQNLDFNSMIDATPTSSKFIDEDYFIWGASMVRDEEGKHHLFYSRWPRELGHNAWVTHSEVAHAVANEPLGPYRHVDVALPRRDPEYWDGLCTHNPTVHEFEGKYYLYYMGNTGDGKPMKTLNWTHRNQQRIGVAVADHPNGPWRRSDAPLIEVSEDPGAPDALIVSNPSICLGPDGKTYFLFYKCVGKKRELPFGGPVVHLVAPSDSPTGPFKKHMEPIFTIPGEMFPAEDPYVWVQHGRFWAMVDDQHGAFTKVEGGALALFTSPDGLHWKEFTRRNLL